MMKFIRKHQKLFFFVITVVVIVTFSFWGSYSSGSNASKNADKIVSRSIGGSNISQSDITMMSWFLSSDWDSFLIAPQRSANLLNDGVIFNDIMKTGIASLIAEKYFAKIKPHLEKNFEKISRFTPYRHPQVDFISAKTVWKEFHPEIYQIFSEIKNQEEVSATFLSLMLKLYQEQLKFPPFMLKRAMLFQQSKFPWVQPDNRLYQEDVSLFGFQTINEWFGDDFLDLISQFILNVAALAEKKEYVVSYEEAKRDLIRNIRKGLQKQDLSEKFNKNHFGSSFEQQLNLLRLSEATAVKVWQKIMLFRKYFQDISNSIQIDPLAFDEFYSYAHEKKEINYYQLPKYLRLNDFEDLLRFQMYLKATGPSLSSTPDFLLELTDIYFPVEEVEKKYPTLVEQRYKIKMKKTSTLDIGLRIGEKDLWAWQLEQENWKKLKEQFFKLTSEANESREKRFKELDKLDPQSRGQIDIFSRKCMVLENKQWIDTQLLEEKEEEKILSFKNEGNEVDLADIGKSKDLQGLLDKIALDPENKDIQDRLAHYTEDENIYYHFTLIERSENKNIVPFHRSVSEGIIDPILMSFLREEHQKMKSTHPEICYDENKEEISFYEIKNHIGKVAFNKVFAALEKICAKDQIFPKGDIFEFYVSYRFYHQMKKVKSQIMSDPENTVWIKKIEDKTIQNPLCCNIADQWKMEMETKDVSRDFQDKKLRERVFDENVKTWSDILGIQEKSPFFFFIKKKCRDKTVFEPQVENCRLLLKNEAICTLADKLMDEMQKAKAIVIPIREKEK